MRFSSLALIFLLTVVMPGNASADCPADAKAPDPCAEVNKLRGQVTALGGVIALSEQKLAAANSEWSKLDRKYLADWYDHNRKLMGIVERAFERHAQATADLHFLVIVLVIVATLISVAEIAYGLLYKPKQAEGAPAAATQQLELSATQIKLATTVSGFMLLLITFAFFYIYVKEIYDLKPIPVANSEATAKQNK